MRRKYGNYSWDSKHPAADSLAKENFVRKREINVSHQKLEVSFDLEKETINGVSTLTFKPVNDKLEKMSFDAIDLKVSKVEIGGKSLDYKIKKESIELTLDKPYNSDEELSVSVTYSVTSPQKGAFFIKPDEGYPNKEVHLWTQGESEENRFWYPTYDTPNQKYTTEAVITCDEKFTALSNGRLVSKTHNKELKTKTFHWLHDVPHVSYLFNIAIGDFDIYEDEYNGIPVNYYAPKGEGDKLKDAFGLTPDMIKFFSKVTGCDYPYAKYSQVVVRDFTWGGMENTTLTIMYDGIIYDKTAKKDVELDSYSLVAHELAHQWFGDLITMKNWQYLWLNESFASYFDPLYFEHKFGKDEFDYRIYKERNGYLVEAKSGYIRPIETNFYNSAEDMFDGHSYNKGACALHNLRYEIGDKMFFKGIRHYVKKHANTCAESSDLRIAFEESTGINIDAFVKQWFQTAGHPKFEISYDYQDSTKLIKLKVKQTQKTDEHVPIFKTPFQVEVVCGENVKQYRFETDSNEQIYYVPCLNEPEAVFFDPDGFILCEIEFKKEKKELLWTLKNGRTVLVRIDAAKQLAKIIGKLEVVEALADCVKNDSFYGVSREAAVALGKIGTDEAKNALLGLLEIPEPKARVGVAQGLGEFKCKDVYDRLVVLFEKDDSYFVRGAAATSAAKANKEGCFDFLKKAIEVDSFRAVIASGAMQGMFEAKNLKGIDLCKAKSTYGNELRTRAAAIRVLGSFGDFFPEKSNDIREFLEELLKDPNFRIRSAAVSALEKIADTKSIEKLDQLVTGEVFGMLKRTAREAILKIRKTEKTKVPKESFETEVNSLKEENKKLKEKIEDIVAKLDSVLKK